ncbi:hypothetical protein G5V59_22380 [Nocardioides sp. W3-2-3]|uniref:hypothetical protein n=1 Tax=Nocardioides convexus TaxID=2712224 RepID=UPI0024183BC5|nr:hypothetical protein [Nocardioides convexus]NHA01593.1 hypothetical protein [Nocardioides convexus]
MDRVPEGPVAQRVAMASGWLHLAADDPDRAREEPAERRAHGLPGRLAADLAVGTGLARTRAAAVGRLGRGDAYGDGRRRVSPGAPG